MPRSAFLGAALAMLALGQSSKCPANAVYAYNIGCDSCDFRAPANGQMTGGLRHGARFSCICSEGYARVKSNGPCIPLAQCPGSTQNQMQCPANEEYIQNLGCDSCENRAYVDGKPPAPCATSPKTSCVCRRGYGRNDDGKCVPLVQCPEPTANTTCVAHATYRLKAGCDTCEERAPDLSNPDRPRCMVMPVMACVCDAGYAMDSSSQLCIPLAQCPGNSQTKGDSKGKCPANEEYIKNPCMAKPMMSCVCDAGYAKATSSGPCVPVSQCPRTRKLFAAGCAMEEEFKLNTGCDSCANRQPGANNTACATAPQYSCVFATADTGGTRPGNASNWPSAPRPPTSATRTRLTSRTFRLCRRLAAVLLGAAPKIAEYWFPENQRALANVLSFIANPLGVAVGSMLPTLLIDESHPTPESYEMLKLNGIFLALGTIVFMLSVASGEDAHRPHPRPPAHHNAFSLRQGLANIFKTPSYVILLVPFGLAFAINWSVFIVTDAILDSLDYGLQLLGIELGVEMTFRCPRRRRAAILVIFGECEKGYYHYPFTNNYWLALDFWCVLSVIGLLICRLRAGTQNKSACFEWVL
ncbi:unnamed protein product, partial [Mesorhabditis spiculigera]